MPAIPDQHGDCPPERIWDEVVTGLLPPDEALAYTEHASWCQPCAQALRCSIEILGAEAAPATSLEFPASAVHRSGRQPLPSYWRLLAAAAVMIIMAGAGYWYWRHSRSADPETLLARIYSAHRSLELRLPGAAYGPLRVERGLSSGTTADQPDDVLDAAARIRHALSQNPRDSAWLRAKGRLAVLEGRPEEGIQSLTAALDWGSSSPDLVTDLAIAYGVKGQRDRAATDLNHAVELLGRALQENPNHPAALFDRALIEAELHEIVPAIADLEKLVMIERSGPWSNETRALLERLRQQKMGFYRRPPGQDAARFDEICLEDALRTAVAGRSGELFALASRLRLGHQDKWFTELLTVKNDGAHAAASNVAIDILGRMATIRLTMESGRYRQESAAFDALSKTWQSRPLRAWHRMEALFRATRAREEFSCPSSSDDILTQCRTGGYHWLLSQILLQHATCFAQAGNVDAAEKYADEALVESSSHNFPIAATRADALLVNIARRRGQYRQAIDRANSSLESVLSGGLPVARSHEFYNVMMGTSDDLGWLHAARTAAMALTETARAAGFRDLQFTNTIRSAQLAILCGDLRESQILFGQAINYYKTLAPSENRAWAEIGFAEATRNDSGLAPFAPELENSRDPIVWIPYQRVRSELAIEHGRLEEARTRLDRIAQWMKGSDASRQHFNQWHAEYRSALSLLLRLLLEQGKDREALDQLQQWRALEELKLFSPDDRARIPAIGTLVFVFLPLDDRFAAWRVDGDTADFHWVTLSRRELERLTRCWHRLISSPQSDATEIDRIGGELRSALFGSWLDSVVPGRALLIQAEQSLAGVAFAVLRGRGEPLGIEHPLSVTTLALPRHFVDLPPSVSTQRMLIIDASEMNAAWASEFPSVAGAQREIASIQSRLSRPADVIRGTGITAGSIRRLAADAGMLHFIGHTVNTSDGIALLLPGTPTPLGLTGLREAGFHAPRTVVLAACSTGENRETETSGPDSLAAAFLFAGSAEVIASLWNVDSESTADFMAEFYRQLGNGTSSGAALQNAMKRARASGRYHHPYYWGAFARFIRV